MPATLTAPTTTPRPAKTPVVAPLPCDEPQPLALREWFRERGFSLFDVTFFALIALLVGLLTVAACGLIPTLNPEAARWGRKLLSIERGLLQTAVLLVGGIAMIAAMAASLGRARGALLPALLTVVVAGVAYLALLGVDYDALYYRRLLPGDGFRPNQRWVARKMGAILPAESAIPAAPLLAAPVAPAGRVVDAVNGRKLFLNTCATCHGAKGEGMPGQGKDLRTSEFVHGLDDAGLAKFIIDGRQPWDPANTTKVAMPGRGGNPMLKDADIKDIVAHIRAIQQPISTAGGAPRDPAKAATVASKEPGGASAATAPAAPASRTAEQLEEDRLAAALQVPKWVVPPPPTGPEGTDAGYRQARSRLEWQTPENPQPFFGVYLFATSMTGAQVLIASFAAAALALSAWRRRGSVATAASSHPAGEPPVSTARFGPPVLLAGVLWWWTTAAWIGMFILLYANG